ncbi:histone-lysine N-methyltransferase NSD2 [Takifugu flavidus]|uniref:histone-lysine N-methyltransferase NSD2 n=1 Tax=Takifugu flavidus TaxID=433684 RepID=UPI00254452DB|nr:histone-lysine N-methyltransferase NSD2 [Takifugu flavidus]
MDSKGSSLPSMPEPANPVSMKQLPEPLSVRKNGGDMSSDHSMLMDKAAAHLAATLQDSVLQKMASHSHGNHSHERLKDLTSLVLNGDQDTLPKLSTPEQPLLKSAEVPTTNGTHQHNCSSHSEPELKVTVPQVVTQQPPFQPSSVNGTSLATTTESTVRTPEKREDAKKRRGRPHKEKPQASLRPAPVPAEPLHSVNAKDASGAVGEPDLKPEAKHKESPLLTALSVGDLVWTKVSGYPWWPCMVTTDPNFNSHFKQKQKASSSKTGVLYHVQYFGDAPERGYVFEKNTVPFTGEDQYHDLCQCKKPPASRSAHKKMAPSVPRKFRAQWNMGIIQAKEALNMPVEERMANFLFLYDDKGPRLNPHIMEKLKPEASLDRDPEFRAQPDLPSQPADPLGDLTAQFSNSTSAEMKGAVSSKEMLHPPAESQDPLSSAAEAQADTSQEIKGSEQTRSAKKTVRRKKSAAENSSDPVKKKRKTAQSRPTEDAPESFSVTGQGVKKRQKKNIAAKQRTDSAAEQDPKTSPERPLSGEAAVKGPGLKKRRKINKEAEKEAGSSEESSKKRRRNKPEKDVTGTQKQQKKAAELLTDDQNAEKPKRKRKRRQDGENQAAASKAKKRRLSPCPDPEVSGGEERPDSPIDSLDGTKKGERKKEFVCQSCETAGEDLVPCEGQCCGMFHLQCLGMMELEDKLLCQECSTGVHSCFHCKKSEGSVRRCHVPHCGKFYHEACIRLNPLTVFDNKGFRCPLHTCLGCCCSSRTKHKPSKGRLMRCLRCPVAYHAGDLCVAAGSEMVTSTAIICTNHFNAKKAYRHHSHVNVSWCFVCSKGGQLLCCESCPAAFHPDCLNIAMPDGSWFCNDCRAGKKPKYRDIIWVKLGKYRWWPAEIHHPRNIPTNIQHLRHEIGEFPVFFFGSRDYFWTHQGRVFPYMEGDRGSKYQRTGIGKVFKHALLEAEARFKEIKMKREKKEAQQYSRKPPPYKFIKVNKPVGKVQVYAADVSEIPKCNCKPSDERPCGFESECLNRMLQYECHPQVCPSGERCGNQDFTQRLYPDTKIIKTPGKGWGLITLRDIKKGEFVNEYIGELIDEEECRARIKYAQENNVTNFYMLTIDKDRIIDAGPKGNYSRFMNHSCQPNCETQKWTVNGDTRVGLFAICDVPAGTELTFNYNLDCLGNEKTACCCGAPNCSGFLGDRPKNSNGHAAEPKAKRGKRKYKKRKSEGRKKSEDECFRCGDGGQLVLCDKKTCTKAYHLTCLNLTKRPFGRWDCPWHHCDVCGKNSEAFCQLCPNSFCKCHQEGALRPSPVTGQLCCQEHEELDVPTSPGRDDGSETNTTSPVGTDGRPPKGSNARTKSSKRKAE